MGEYLAKITEVFKEVRRVLRDDGTCWLNLGDSFSSGKGTCYNLGGGASSLGKERKEAGVHLLDRGNKSILALSGLKSKDLCGIPWRVALALQEDGWYLRCDIIWHKPNPMPESVMDRPTKAHEYIFLLAKSERYYYDQVAIMEPVAASTVNDARLYREGYAVGRPERGFPGQALQGAGMMRPKHKPVGWQSGPGAHGSIPKGRYPNSFKGSLPGRKDGPGQNRRGKGDRIHGNVPGRDDGGNACNIDGQFLRNRRSVWTVPTSPFKEAHFATFPPDLIRPAILAGCPMGGMVLDPFGGSGTVGEVAEMEGRNSILIELKPEYVKLAKTRTAQGGLFCRAAK